MSWPMTTFLTTTTCWCHKSKGHSWSRSLYIKGLGKAVLCFKIMTWDDDNFKTHKCGLKHRFKLCLNCATGIQSYHVWNRCIDTFHPCFSCSLFITCIVLDSEKMSCFTPEDDVQLHVVAAGCPAWGESSYNTIPNPMFLTKSRWDMALLLFHHLQLKDICKVTWVL